MLIAQFNFLSCLIFLHIFPSLLRHFGDPPTTKSTGLTRHSQHGQRHCLNCTEGDTHHRVGDGIDLIFRGSTFLRTGGQEEKWEHPKRSFKKKQLNPMVVPMISQRFSHSPIWIPYFDRGVTRVAKPLKHGWNFVTQMNSMEILRKKLCRSAARRIRWVGMTTILPPVWLGAWCLLMLTTWCLANHENPKQLDPKTRHQAPYPDIPVVCHHHAFHLNQNGSPIFGQIQNENHLWNLVRNYNVTSLQATYVLVSLLLLWLFCHDQVYRHHC